MLHICHARNCTVPIHQTMLMCRRHWFMVPKPLRHAVWRNYRPGQEQDKEPTIGWLDAAHAAIEAVAEREERDE